MALTNLVCSSFGVGIIVGGSMTPRRTGVGFALVWLLSLVESYLVHAGPADGCGVMPWKGWKRGDGTQPQIPAQTPSQHATKRQKTKSDQSSEI